MVSSQIKTGAHPLNRNDDIKEKSNYWPISILSKVSKVCESLYEQIYDFFENRFPKYQCGFCKDLSTQNVLLSMVEKMLLTRDKKDCGAMLTDLSKAF